MSLDQTGDRNTQIDYMLTSIESEGRNLTEWERNYIESVRDQFTNRGGLSDRQVEILERIYVEKV